MCPTKDRYKREIFPLGYMDMDLYKQIVSECAEYHGADMTLNLHKDGEPLMHPHIGEMIAYAKSYGMFVHFATNGLLLGKKKEELVDNGLDLITVSAIDETAIRALNEFMQYKKNKPPYVNVKYFDDEAEKHKGQTRTSLPLSHPLVRFKDTGAETCYLFVGWHLWTDAEFRTDKFPCTKILYSMAISWEGLINPCCLDYKRSMVLGKFPKNTLMEGWEKLKKVHEFQHKHIWKPPCTTCDYYQRLEEDETKIIAEWACTTCDYYQRLEEDETKIIAEWVKE
jgi:MoaA/NifB/PqqE/SkfB family radical SAM enzyme